MRKLENNDIVLTWRDGTIAILDHEEYEKIMREHGGCELLYGSIKATLGIAFKCQIAKCLEEEYL